MAGAADGSVIIKVEMQTDQVKAGVEDIKTGCKRAAGAAEDMGSKICACVSDTAKAGAAAGKSAGTALDGLRKSLDSVKLGLATAFAPVLTAAAPLLQKLCGMLATAASYVTMFFAVLGGGKRGSGVTGAGKAAAATAAAAKGARVASVGTDGAATADYAAAGPAVMPIARAAAASEAAGGGKGSAAGYAVMAAAIDAAGESAARFEKTATASFEAVGQAIDATADRAGGTAEAISSAGEAASDTAGNVKDIAKAARQAERNLSGLDEMHIWKTGDEEASTGGGGRAGSGGSGKSGGKAGAAAGSAFADALAQIPIDETLEHWMHHILTLAEAVAAGLAAWKLARGFGADMRTAAGMALSVAGAVALVRGGLEAWSRGVDWGNLLEMLGGTAALAGGLALSFGKVGGAVGLLIGGVTMLVTALHEWITTGELSNKALGALESGIGAVGIALGLLTGSWVPLAIAAAVGLAAAIAARWDDIKQWTIQKFTAVKDWLAATWESIRSAVVSRAEAIKTAVRDRFESIRSNISEKLTAAKEKVVGIFDGIRDAIREKIEWARDKVQGAIEKIKGFFDFKWELPKIKLPHFKLTGEFSLLPPKVPKLSVEWYARGGIVDGATLIGAGEAGKEAIVPLERHTQWIDALAARLARLLGASDRIEQLGEVAERLDGLAVSIQRLGLAIERTPVPVMATGTVIPPRAAYTGGTVQGLPGGDALRQLLAARGSDGKAQDGEASYTFIAKLNGATLFSEMIRQGKLRQRQTGKNPFDL